jgi:hypothetical protein
LKILFTKGSTGATHTLFPTSVLLNIGRVFRMWYLFYISVAHNSMYDSRSRPPLWSSSQSSLLQIQRSRVRFLALPDFLRSSGSGTGSTQNRE